MKTHLTRASVTLILVLMLAACSLPGSGTSDFADSAACLQGNWEMANSDVNQMIMALVPTSNMSIPVGTFKMTFNESQFIYFSEGFSLRVELADGYIEADSSFETEGNFTTSDGLLTLTDLVTIQDTSTWRAVINGETAEYPGAGATLSAPVPGDGPFTCSETTLGLETIDMSGAAFTMTFSRVP